MKVITEAGVGVVQPTLNEFLMVAAEGGAVHPQLLLQKLPEMLLGSAGPFSPEQIAALVVAAFTTYDQLVQEHYAPGQPPWKRQQAHAAAQVRIKDLRPKDASFKLVFISSKGTRVEFRCASPNFGFSARSTTSYLSIEGEEESVLRRAAAAPDHQFVVDPEECPLLSDYVRQKVVAE